MRPTPTRRGYAALLALMVVAAIGALASAGLEARTRDLGFEERGLCRAQARHAAESAVAVGRAALAAGHAPPTAGALRGAEGFTIGWALRTRRLSEQVLLEAEGTCSSPGPGALARHPHTSRASLEVRLQPQSGRWRVVSWREGGGRGPQAASQ